MRQSLRAAASLLGIALWIVGCVEPTAPPTREKPAGVTFYVATNGSDAWSGRSADPNAAKTDGPFATLARARDAIRRLKSQGRFTQPVTVMLRGGSYELAEKLTFRPEDTGAADSPITYTSYPGERAVLSGGRRIPGPWRQSPGKPYWETTIPDAANGQWRFHSLFVNGMSRDRARQPNWGEKELRAEGRAPGEDERQSFVYFPGDINPSWTRLTDIDIVLLCSWTPTVHRIREISPDRRVVRFLSTHSRAVDVWDKNARYYLANVFEALDAPGEWYLNRSTGALFYYPMPGEDMARAEVIAPVLKSRLVEFLGDVDKGRCIEHLRFRDLDFRHVDGDLDRYNGMYRQGHMFLDAAIYAEGLRSSMFHNCEIAQVGEYAVEMAKGCRDNRIEHCHIWDTGAGAMQIGVTDLSALLSECNRPRPDDIVLEAEEAAVTAPMRIERDGAASKGGYVTLPAGLQGGQAVFSVTVPEDAEYRVCARVLAPSGSADSFTVQVNDGPQVTYDTGVKADWFMSPVTGRDKPFVAPLKKGTNTLVIGGREAGAKLDQLLLRPKRDDDPTGVASSQATVLSNVVDNNFIHRTGTIWHGCYGIVNRFASLSQITHNEISDTHWDPIGLDARWDYHGEKYSHGNVVAFNHLHHLGLRYHTDAGGIYQFGPLDTHIHHNLIHDTRAYPYICGFTGVYLDEQSRGAVVENNLVYNVEWSAFLQNWGMDNTFRNNIGAFARDGFFHRGGVNEHHKSNRFEAAGNIYIAADNVAIQRAWQPGLVPPVLRKNIYFSTTAGAALTFADKSFAEWQAQGYDADSLLADPGCADPAKLDFSLKPDALAVKAIGFKPFDKEIRTAGIYGDEAWVNLPKKCPMRTPSKIWTPEELARLICFRYDFEDMPDGYEPPAFKLAKDGAATFAVTSEAVRTGKKSLKCTDRKGLKKAFYPYIHIAPKKLNRGRIVFSFDAMLPRDNPVGFYVEFRGSGTPQAVGPSVHFSRDGRMVANDKEVTTIAPGTWGHIEISFELGPGAPKEYGLVAGVQGAQKDMRIPFKDAAFSDITWLGVSACDDADGVFYLDNMALQISGPSG